MNDVKKFLWLWLVVALTLVLSGVWLSETLAPTSFGAILALGFFLGLRHAADADHIAAVTTFVSKEASVIRTACRPMCSAMSSKLFRE